MSYLLTTFLILIVGGRYIVTYSYLGQIPFNCDFNHYLPDNIKIACKARFISCTLGFSSYLLPFVLLLINGSFYLFKILRHLAFNYLQKNLFVL
jgi:hypothetical protein